MCVKGQSAIAKLSVRGITFSHHILHTSTMPNYYTGEHRAKEHAFSFLKKRPIRLNLKKSFLFRANRWLVRNVGYDILAFLRTFISQINEVGFPSRLVTQFFTSNPFNFVFLPFFFFPLLVKMSDKKYRAKTHLT